MPTKKNYCPAPDNVREYSETTHHEYNLGDTAQILDIEFLIECESDAYGMYFIVECLDKNGNPKIYRTFVTPLDEPKELIKDLNTLTKHYKCVSIENIILVFILEE